MFRSIFLIFLFVVFANARLTRRDLLRKAISKGEDVAKQFADALPEVEPETSLPEDAKIIPKETTKNLSPVLSKQNNPYHHHHYHHQVSNQGQKCCNQDKLDALIQSIKEQSVLLREMAKRVVRHLDVNIVSEGCEDKGRHGGCGYAFIKVNGIERSLKRRGYNVVVLNRGGCFEEAKSFDTHGNPNEVRQLVDYIKNIHDNSIVLMAIQDDGSHQVRHNSNLKNALAKALKSVGCEDQVITDYRHSWACAGHKGKENASWVKLRPKKARSGSYPPLCKDPLLEGS